MLWSQDCGAVLTTLEQPGPVAASDFGKDDAHFEVLGMMPDFNLAGLFGLEKAIFRRAFNIEILNIATVLGFVQRDEDVPAVALLITVYHLAGGALVIGKNLAVTPGVILEGVDVILQKLDPLPLLEAGFAPFGIQQFQSRVVLQDFVHALPAVAAEPAAQGGIQVEQQDEPGGG